MNDKQSKQKVKNTTLNKLTDTLKDQDVGNKNIAVFIGKGTIKTNDKFVIMFYNNVLADILRSKLTITDVKVMLAVLDKVSLGNVINLTQREIAASINMKQPQVCRAIKKLTASKIFLTNEHGSLFLNPNYMAKQNLRSLAKSEAYQIAVNLAQVATSDNEQQDMAF